MKRLLTLSELATTTLILAIERPNVGIIYGDNVGAYGCKNPTPNIDKLANEGLMLTDGHCAAATRTPSTFFHCLPIFVALNITYPFW